LVGVGVGLLSIPLMIWLFNKACNEAIGRGLGW
jgi:hypothetical protein